MVEFLLLYTFVFLCAVHVSNFYTFVRLKFHDSRTYIYDGITCNYRGHEVHINVVTNKRFFDGGFYNRSSCNTYIINNVPVAKMYKLEQNFHISRIMVLNCDYDTSDFYKILKQARRQHMREIKDMLNDKPKKSIFSVDMEGDDDNENVGENENTGRN